MKKPPHPLRPIYWSFGVMIILMTLLFGMGFYYQNVLGKIQAQLTARPTSADLDARLSKRIGKTYDKKLHNQLIDAFDSGDTALHSIVKASDALSKGVLQVAGASTLAALCTVFLLIKKSHDFRKDTPAPVTPPTSES